MKKHLLVALGIALIAAAPLTYPGPLQTHAGLTPIFALMGDATAVEEVGPAVLTLARGINSVAHWLPSASAGTPAGAGFMPGDAFKILDGLAFVLGALGMFVLARPLFGDAGALAASAVYTLLPYRLMTAYIRGSDGETLFLGLLPWMLAGGRAAAEIATRRARPRRVAPVQFACWSACAVAVVVLWRVCVTYAPDPTQTQAYLFQVFSARWDYGGQGGWLGAAPLQLGIVPAGLAVVALVSKPDRLAVAAVAAAGVLVALSIEPLSSWWPWAWVLSAPWQLLGIAGMCLALTAGAMVARGDGMQSLPALAAVITLVVLGSYAYLEPRGTDYTPVALPLARYGNLAYLADVAVPPLQAGRTVTVTLVWQDITPFADDYTVFVHLIDDQDKIRAQRDAQPLRGARPTRSWQRGEVLRDPYALTIPADAPDGLRVEVGLYRSDNGQRLRTTRGDDRTIIAP